MSTEETIDITLSNQIELYHKKIIQDAKNSVAVLPPDQMFESLKNLKEKTALQMEEALSSVENIANKGVEALKKALQDMGKESEANEIYTWIFTNASKLIEAVQKGEEDESIEKRIGFPRIYLNLMSQAAEHLRIKNQYEEAIALMAVCLFFNAGLYDLWITYGQILQDKGDISDALYAYCFASLIDEQNPYPYLHSVKPWLMLGNWKKAEESLKKATDCCKATPKYTELLNYCQVVDDWIIAKKK